MNSAIQYHERTLCFGPDRRLIGTVTLPPRPEATDLPGLILLNAGALPRIGPHRLNVELARTAAIQGICAVRFDLPGLGDSGFINSEESHEQQTFTAVRHAMELLSRTACAPRRFIIAGLCSGADVGYLMALQDKRVCGIFMIEPYYFPSRLSGLLRTLRRVREYGLRRAVLRISQRLRGYRNHPSSDDSSVPPPPPEESVRSSPSTEEFAHGLKQLVDRQVWLRLIYANTLMGQYDMRKHERGVFRELVGNRYFELSMTPHTDHLFTRTEARRSLVRQMAAWLEHFDTRKASEALKAAQESSSSDAHHEVARPVAHDDAPEGHGDTGRHGSDSALQGAQVAKAVS